MRLHRPALTLLSLALMTQSALALDLKEAYAKASLNDPNWLAARNNYLAGQQESAISRGGLLPSIVATGQLSSNTFEPADPTPATPVSAAIATTEYDSTQWSVKATQPLFRADAWYDYQRARAVSSQAEATFRGEEQNLALRVSVAYFSVLSAQETLAYAESEEAALGRQLDQAQQRFDVGLIAVTDVLEARATYDASRANRIAAEAALSSAIENLGALIGEVPGKLAPLKPDAPMQKPIPDDPEAWVKLARERNPDLIASRKGYDSAVAISRRVKSGFLPMVDLYASYSDSERDAANGAFVAQNGSTESVGVEATWALFQGGSTYAASKQASYYAAAAQDAAIGTEKTVVNNTRKAFLNVTADSYRVEARRQAVESSSSSLEATQAGYEVGTRNIVDVLLSQRQSYAAKRDYASSRYDYVLNTLRLKAASGQLKEVDIRELNSWLDPNASVISVPEKPAEAAPPPAPAPAGKKGP